MAAEVSTLGAIHKALAQTFLKALEEGVRVSTFDKEGEETISFRPLNSSELGVIVAFLKNNNITASVSDNDALKALQDKLTGKRKTIRPVMDDSDGAPVWQ